MRHKSGPADSHSGRGGIGATTTRSVSAEQRSLTAEPWPELHSRPSKTIRGFAPPGWTGPSLEEIDEGYESLADEEDVYCVLAESKDEVVGQITVSPATRALHPDDDPALGHICNFTVTRDFWGTGLAGNLHRAAVDAARERGLAGCGYRARRSSSRAPLLRWVAAVGTRFASGSGGEFGRRLPTERRLELEFAAVAAEGASEGGAPPQSLGLGRN